MIFLLFLMNASFSSINYKTEIRPIFEKYNCVSCHRIGKSIDIDFSSEKSLLDYYIEPGNLEYSDLFVVLNKKNLDKKFGEFDEGDMPLRGDPLSSEDINKIAEWILSLKNTQKRKSLNSYIQLPRTGDRKFISKKLAHLFGPSSKNIINSKIASSPESFGAPCDMYQKQDRRLDPLNFCRYRTSVTRAALIPQISTPFEGGRLQACESLTAKPETLLFFLKKFLDIDSYANSVPSLNEARKTYKAFYPGQAIDLKLVNGALHFSFDPLKKRFLSWRMLVYQVCMTPGWTIP